MTIFKTNTVYIFFDITFTNVAIVITSFMNLKPNLKTCVQVLKALYRYWFTAVCRIHFILRRCLVCTTCLYVSIIPSFTINSSLLMYITIHHVYSSFHNGRQPLISFPMKAEIFINSYHYVTGH